MELEKLVNSIMFVNDGHKRVCINDEWTDIQPDNERIVKEYLMSNNSNPMAMAVIDCKLNILNASIAKIERRPEFVKWKESPIEQLSFALCEMIDPNVDYEIKGVVVYQCTPNFFR